MKTRKVLPGETVWGLLVLLVILGLAVWQVAPQPKTPDEQKQLLQAHEGALYFFEGESMAKQLLPDPALRWTHAKLDKGTGCTYIANGVWYAAGRIISGPVERMPVPLTWEALFLPDEHEPLYVRVGDMATGDPHAALRRAGYASGRPIGVPVEKQ